MLHEATQNAASAPEFVGRAAKERRDPRESHKDFLAFAQTVADLADKSEPLRDAILRVDDVVRAQVVADADADAAKKSGWPEISGLPSSPFNLAYAVARVNVHTALSPELADQPMPDADGLARALRATADELEPGFMSAVVGGAAREMDAGDAGFATAMAQAAEDVGQLLKTTDLPQSLVDLIARRRRPDVDGADDADTNETLTGLMVVALVLTVLFVVGCAVILVRWCKHKHQ